MDEMCPRKLKSGQEVSKFQILVFMDKKNLKKALAAIAVLGLVSEGTTAPNSTVSLPDLSLTDISVANKLVLSRESVIAEYSRITRLAEPQRQAIAANIQSNFAGFMNETFYLSENQVNCLTNHWNKQEDIAFINLLAARIEAGDIVAWDIDLTDADAPPVLAGKPKKRKVEGGYSEKDGWNIKFSIEF